jgi:hypothetical protein
LSRSRFGRQLVVRRIDLDAKLADARTSAKRPNDRTRLPDRRRAFDTEARFLAGERLVEKAVYRSIEQLYRLWQQQRRVWPMRSHRLRQSVGLNLGAGAAPFAERAEDQVVEEPSDMHRAMSSSRPGRFDAASIASRRRASSASPSVPPAPCSRT